MRWILLFLFISSCTIFEQDIQPNRKVESIDFDARVSRQFPGLVKFSNASSCLSGFEWSFGFIENGRMVTSKAMAPTITYPENGNYLVTLSGFNEDSTLYELSKEIEIRSY